LWGRKICMDFSLFPPLEIRRRLEDAGFVIEDVIEREPYPPDVEYQSHRAHIFARKPHNSAREQARRATTCHPSALAVKLLLARNAPPGWARLKICILRPHGRNAMAQKTEP
jgi:hypothetical protein